MKRLPHVPSADELIDKAFKRAARARHGKSRRTPENRVKAEWSFITTASSILSDNLNSIPKGFPNLDELPPFEFELVDALVGVDALRHALGSLSWAGEKIPELKKTATAQLKRGDDANMVRRRASGRMVSVVRQVEKELALVLNAKKVLNRLPTLLDAPTIVVSGFPNVGKSSFVGAVSSASPEVAAYPFTTTQFVVGHALFEGERIQLVDVPGLLKWKNPEKKKLERQAAAVLNWAGDVVLFMLDTTGSCGYPLEEQLSLLGELKAELSVPVLVAASKRDLPEFTPNPEADMELSVYDRESVEAVLVKVVGVAREEHKRRADAAEEFPDTTSY
ncbi:MAG: NOG1 family protein [Methermicoccaceae archaeon]